MYKVYILYSEKNKKYYIGHTNDIDDRMRRHNRGLVKSTKSGCPWKIIYTEDFDSKNDAYRREFQIKSYKKGEAFKNLIKHGQVAEWSNAADCKSADFGLRGFESLPAHIDFIISFEILEN